MKDDELLRLIIVDDSQHLAEQIVSTLRSSGVHVRAEFGNNEERVREILEQQSFDMMLFSSDMSDFSLAEVKQVLTDLGLYLSLVAMTKHPDYEKTANAMKSGARDMVCIDIPDHFISVVQRECKGIRNWREKAQFERAYHDSERRCLNLLRNSRDAIAYVHEGMHIYANSAYLDLFGFTDPDDIEGMPIMDMVASSEQADFKTFLRQHNQDKNAATDLHITLKHTDDSEFDGQMEFSRASFDNEPCTQIIIRNRADTKELEEQINYLNQHDLLTGLYNRRYFMDELQITIDKAINGDTHAALLNFTLDNFDEVKELHGIAGSDVLLANIATLLKENTGEHHLVARFGTQYFAALCYNETQETVVKLVNALQEGVAKHISEYDGHSINTTCSIGINFIDENSPVKATEVMLRGERASREALKSGGNSYNVFRPAADEMTQLEQDTQISTEITDAINDDRMLMLYQPIVSLKNNPGERYSIVLRLFSKDGDYLSPSQFFPAAERCGLSGDIDRWVITNALKRMSDAQGKGKKTTFFVKLTGGSFVDPGLLQWLAEQIKSSKAAADRLVFEVKEESVVTHLKEAKVFIKGLEQLQCKFCLDDFGTGLNPFLLLKHIKVHYLKVHPAFMDNLSQTEQNQKSLKDIADKATETGIETIVQHVEDAASMSTLWTMNVNYIQGHFLQEPTAEMNYDFSSM
ncbi:MAG: GGDEF domain-containing response regulator [Colwellia sp.]|nr:GGDEF domain-containing response regulator [Colwellia sp.]